MLAGAGPRAITLGLVSRVVVDGWPKERATIQA
jgi:hypothetical protein